MMTHARPNAERLRIDAIWGFPDGLSYFPHDTWFYYPSTQHAVEHRGFKSTCLLPDRESWTPKRLGQPFDWAQVVRLDEVAIAGEWALKLANALNSEVQLMVLARIGNTRGAGGCLPWHYTNWNIVKYNDSRRMLPPKSAMEVVKNRDDLTRLALKNANGPARGLLIAPEPRYLRDDDFLAEIGLFASRCRRPIYFEGSVLSHAYYIMRRVGASVIPITQDEPKDVEKIYNKLVRDEIPSVIKRAGGLSRIRQVSSHEAQQLLRQKLIEESCEVRDAVGDDLIGELADVLEVVDSLREHNGIVEEVLNRVQRAKRAKRGGFGRAIYLESTGLDSLQQKEARLGTLPLFDADDTVPSTRRATRPEALVQLLPSQNDAEMLRFSLSLVPPALEIDGFYTLQVEALDSLLHIEYCGSTALCSIGKLPSPGSDQQLLLFADAHTEGTL
jgi:predicted house-cleaning noncanonical NTP pyrophosphatase (MazG superfamily)